MNKAKKKKEQNNASLQKEKSTGLYLKLFSIVIN